MPAVETRGTYIEVSEHNTGVLTLTSQSKAGPWLEGELLARGHSETQAPVFLERALPPAASVSRVQPVGQER